jgi:hypothetical protein
METQGLLFIPDISGFTRFVTDTEIDHSRRIIQELLEAVIDANQTGLQVSEVEGDAVLFYKFGVPPDLGQLSQQVERMFREFHERLAAYEFTRFCQCRACVSASSLTLKIITHYGEFTSYSVRQFNKLIGRDVIVAHQLLKNDIDQHEYWLVTTDLLPDRPPADLAAWIRWNQGVKHTESGDIAFHYTPLSELRQTLAPAPLPDLGLSRQTRMFSVSREYDAHIIRLFHATGDFAYRSRWQEGVLRVEEVSHHLPRIGMQCRRVMEDGQVTFFASSYSFRPDRIVFSETDENRMTSSYFNLERLDTYRTLLTVDFYVKQGPIREFIFRLTKRKQLEASLQRSLHNLDTFVKTLTVPVDY